MYKKMNNKAKILSAFLTEQELYLRQISKLTGLTIGTTKNTLDILIKENILKAKVRGKNRYFRLNNEEPSTRLQIIKTEIEMTIEFLEKKPLFKPFLKQIPDMPILIFGSFATDKEKKDSDVDMLIIGKEKIPTHLLPYKIHEIRLAKKLTKKAMKQEDLMKEIKEKHIILNNHQYFVDMWKDG